MKTPETSTPDSLGEATGSATTHDHAASQAAAPSCPNFELNLVVDREHGAVPELGSAPFRAAACPLDGFPCATEPCRLELYCLHGAALDEDMTARNEKNSGAAPMNALVSTPDMMPDSSLPQLNARVRSVAAPGYGALVELPQASASGIGAGGVERA